MNTLPAPTVDEVPSWRELRDRFGDLMKDIRTELREIWSHDGNHLRREARARAVPALRRVRAELDKLITRLEERLAKEPPPPPG